MPQDQTRRRRILFRATHRGTYENDLLIGGFVRARLDGFTESEMDVLEALMELPDPVLAGWLTGRQPIPAEADSPMLRAMRQAAVDGHAIAYGLPNPLPRGEGLFGGEGRQAETSACWPGHPHASPLSEENGAKREQGRRS